MSATAGDQIADTLRRRLGCEVLSIRPAAGGDISDAYRAETSHGPLFVKTRPGAATGTYAAEAAGLDWLGEPGGLTVPGVVLVHDPCPGDDADPPAPRFLALQWIEPGPRTPQADELLGRGLALVHASGAPAFGFSPAGAASRFGELELPNEERESFAQFWLRCRLEPLLGRSREALGADGVALIERVANRLPELAGPAEPPARTHGDLWSGNVLVDAAGVPHLIDPAAHGGHREVDLATLRVFGGPSQRCFDAYDEVHPLADGHQDRVALWQLEIILLHVALFGGAYAQQAISLARRYA